MDKLLILLLSFGLSTIGGGVTKSEYIEKIINKQELRLELEERQPIAEVIYKQTLLQIDSGSWTYYKIYDEGNKIYKYQKLYSEITIGGLSDARLEEEKVFNNIEEFLEYFNNLENNSDEFSINDIEYYYYLGDNKIDVASLDKLVGKVY